MGIKRIVDTGFWTDDKVVESFSPEDKLFMLYLMTNPHTTQLGIYPLNKKIMSFELGYSVDAISVLLDRFETKYDIIRFSKETNEIAIKNSLRHSIVKGGAPVRDCLIKEIKHVKDKKLLKFVFRNLKQYALNATVTNLIAEYEEKNGELSYCNENINENDNENENDNDVSLQRYVDDTLTIRQRIVNESSKPNKKPKRKPFTPPTLEEIKAYCLERKNNVDAQKFYDYFSASDWYDSKGNKVKSWKQKIITWENNGFNNKKSEVITDEQIKRNVEENKFFDFVPYGLNI
jgi:hypothetical protein